MKINVMGAGLAGSWLTRIARARGHRVVLHNDEEPPSTLAAIALLRSTHMGSDRHLLKQSLREMKDAGILYYEGAWWSRWNREGEKFQDDWYTIDPHKCLIAPDVIASEPTAKNADATVWCTGPALAGERTYGATWVHPDPNAVNGMEMLGAKVHLMAPYKVLAAVAYSGSGARLGSSSAADPDKAVLQANKMFQTARDLGWLRTKGGWDLVLGARVKRDTRIEHLSPGVWSWGGFHRTGFGIAPAEASTVLDALEQEYVL